jgi:hypothetical protein
MYVNMVTMFKIHSKYLGSVAFVENEFGIWYKEVKN